MQSTTIIAFDQHAATTVAAVLLPGHRTPALHHADVGHRRRFVRFVERLQRQGAGDAAATKRAPAASSCSARCTAHGIPCDVIAPGADPAPRRAIGSRPTAAMPASSPCCIAPAR